MKKKDFPTWLIILINVVFALGVITGAYFLDRKEFEDCANYPPTVDWVEEDLEPTFMTTGVIVYEAKEEWCNNYYKVTANGLYYKVHYAVHHDFLFNYSWHMINYIQIKGE